MMLLSDLNWFKSNKFKENSDDVLSMSPKKLGITLDHMELIAICSIDKKYSTDDLSDYLHDNNSFNEKQYGNLDNEEEYPNRVSYDEILRQVRIRFERRRDKWKPFWPFNLEISERGCCSLKFIEDHPYAITYVYFLLALYSKYIHHPNIYRNEFERICFLLMLKLLPPNSGWVVKRTGTNVKSSESNAYAGNKIDKLKLIAKDLELSSPNFRRKLTTSGDGGIDLIAFNKLYDDRGKIPAIFMQCACSADIEELEHKTWDASYDKLNQLLHLDVKHEHFIFSPYDWFDHLETDHFVIPSNGAVVFDRHRILHYLVEQDVVFTFPSHIQKHLHEFISVEENFS